MRQRISKGKSISYTTEGSKGVLLSYTNPKPRKVTDYHRVIIDGVAEITERVFFTIESQEYLFGDNLNHSIKWEFANSNTIETLTISTSADAGVPTISVKFSDFDLSDLKNCTQLFFEQNNLYDFSNAIFPTLKAGLYLEAITCTDIDSDIDLTNYGTNIKGYIRLVFEREIGSACGRPIFSPTVNTNDVSLDFYSFSNSIKGDLDISMFEGLFYLDMDATQTTTGIGKQMTGLSIPATIKAGALPFTKFRIQGDMLVTGTTSVPTIDLSNYHNLGGDIRVKNIDAMTSLIMPTTVINELVTHLHFEGNENITSLDLSNFNNVNGQIQVHNCKILTTLILPQIGSTISRILAYGTLLNWTILDLTGYVLTAAELDFTRTNVSQGSISDVVIDLSQRANVKYLQLEYQQLTSLDLSDYLYTGFSFYGSNNLSLTTLLFSDNVLGSLFTQNTGVTSLNFSLCGWVSSVVFRFTNSTSLTSLILPTSDANLLGRPNHLEFGNSPINNIVDLSRQLLIPIFNCYFSNTGSSFDITFPIAGSEMDMSGVLSLSNIGSVTVDLSGFDNMSNSVSISNNTVLTDIILKTGYSIALASRPTIFRAENNTIINIIDFKVFTGINTLPNTIDIANNNWIVQVVNEVLDDLAGMVGQYPTGTLIIDGNNDAPNGSAGGFDGLAAVTTLINAGWSVTTS